LGFFLVTNSLLCILFALTSARVCLPVLQVRRLMQPHFRFTLNINSNALKGLTSAGGVIERTFSPGAYAMRLSAEAYKYWSLPSQALPTDLKKR